MRIAIPTLALLALAIAAVPLATTDFAARMKAAGPSDPEALRMARATPAAAAGRGDTPSASAGSEAASSAAANVRTPRAPNPEAAARSRASTPSRLPATLELVTLPGLHGGAASAARTISRAEAVAAVMGSQEYQETVAPLARLYHATFGRFLDYEGINYYTGQREDGRPLGAIADEFAGSREFEMRYGNLDNAEFVARILANVLGSASQADVRAYWTAELDAGRMTRGQVIVDLAESGAFRERSAHEVFVSMAYIEILRRTPDPAGYARWVAHLDAGHPYQSVIDGLLASR